MDISFLRSSSIGTWSSFCQHKYYMIYVLGMEDPPNKKTEVGTVVHCVLEVLAGMKKSYQETGKYEYIHPGIGKFECKISEFMKPYSLKDIEIDSINKSRKNKDTYKDQKFLDYGHKRYGVNNVQEIFERSYEYYRSKSKHEWSNIEYRNALNFTWMELDWSNGEFDPRKRNIIYPELPFNIEIKKDWAKLENGEYLRIKGTIDLVTNIGDNVIEIIDYKTGQRLDWGSKPPKIKTYEDLMKDPQLMLYYYAARKALPDYEAIMLTIFFIRDGGPFTLAFDDDILEKVENDLRKNFEEIRDCKKPKLRDRLHKEFQCNKLCGFYKEQIENSCTCDYISNEIDVYGIDLASKRNRAKGFQVGTYNQPGA